jgi:hypothetical protein
MIRDNLKLGLEIGDPDYEDPNTADAIVVPGSELSLEMKEESCCLSNPYPRY